MGDGQLWHSNVPTTPRWQSTAPFWRALHRTKLSQLTTSTPRLHLRPEVVMASKILTAVAKAGDATPIRAKRALVSVFDKTGVIELCKALAAHDVEILSTGGTARSLREAGITVRDVADATSFPEILDGRVKTLHPAVHGPLLAVRGNAKHEEDLKANKLGEPIDIVVTNLYPFEDAVASTEAADGACATDVIENIDIGGPTMLRAAAKNHAGVAVLTDPAQYEPFAKEFGMNGGKTSHATRQRLAAAAFAASATYEAAVAEWMTRLAASQATPEAEGERTAAASASFIEVPKPIIFRGYREEMGLKYGNNPHQPNAAVLSIARGASEQMPFQVINGKPGYINLLDALNAWSLVKELKEGLGIAAAASFKHVSPAGAALGLPLTPRLAQAYDEATIRRRVGGEELSPAALAYLRARNADPLCSFGDFAAVSDVVDEATARVIKPEVSDGIIAPGYTEEALRLLASKKKGAFIILQATDAPLPAVEYREVHGVGLRQARNQFVYTPAVMGASVTKEPVPEHAMRDLTLAATTVKYTQSNSVGFASGGQMVGIGAGQQSRVDCVKLAARKAQTWWLRQHDKVLELPFAETMKRQDKVNARVGFIEDDFTAEQRAAWLAGFTSEPAALTTEERAEWLSRLSNEAVCLASDAFFPFRDGLDAAASIRTKYVAQPGGSIGDAAVIEAANEYGMAMLFHGHRAFHH